MENNSVRSFTILGIAIGLGLSFLGLILGNAAIKFKEYERTVTVKGLSEQEHLADVVIWPIQFTVASNQLENIYVDAEQNTVKIKAFLNKNGLDDSEISFAAPKKKEKNDVQKWFEHLLPDNFKEHQLQHIEKKEEAYSLIELMESSFSVTQDKLTSMMLKMYPPELLIKIPRNTASTFDFDKAKHIYKMGKKAYSRAK